ncbi:hypothetical protein [Brucella sp. 2280]|uniref:hypothetical protein n=1 Tax=Brucella sp. 2280 TaxID=2592625 RepID=UPI001294DA92|nr:hypothetical protein [Brucella sp. 2280]QGA56249.1 hypothetical protein GHC20_03750 [Brucella sp. 2280]
MPKSSIPANAEGLSKLSRRSILVGGTAACVSAVVVGASTAAEPEMTALERVDHLLAELKAAVEKANPRVRLSHSSNFLDDPTAPLPALIVFEWVSGKYEGDGLYFYALGGRDKLCEVALLDHQIDGERGFSVIPLCEHIPQKWLRLPESRLGAFIGEKVIG